MAMEGGTCPSKTMESQPVHCPGQYECVVPTVTGQLSGSHPSCHFEGVEPSSHTGRYTQHKWKYRGSKQV